MRDGPAVTGCGRLLAGLVRDGCQVTFLPGDPPRTGRVAFYDTRSAGAARPDLR